MDLKAARALLEGKHVLGEHGPVTRPFVILDVDEYHALLGALVDATEKPKRRVPREQVRAG